MNDWSGARSESGWTMYLDQSYTSDHRFGSSGGGRQSYRKKEEEEEDLSMVSDASSGPQHYIESNEQCFNNNGYSSYAYSASESPLNCSKEDKKKKKKNSKPNGRNNQHSYLDDTASSHVYAAYGKATKSLEENEVDFSQGFSATHFKRKSAVRKHFGFYGCEKSGAEE